MKFMLGRKVGMTQIFDEDGLAIPVTVIDCGPITVLRNKTVESDGYEAVKVAYEPWKKGNKPHNGIFAKLNLEPTRIIKEFRSGENLEIGTQVKVSDMFGQGDVVDIAGKSKGKGYQGAIKRHGFSRGPKSHGSKYHRHAGSQGSSATPSKVKKGKKLPGQMGSERVTVQNLKVIKADGERNILMIHGAVPGPKGGLLEITSAVKSAKA